MASSLKAPHPVRNLRYDLEGNTVRLQIDGAQVPLDNNQSFAETIVADTVRGMIRHLKGVDPEGAVRIEVEIESQS